VTTFAAMKTRIVDEMLRDDLTATHLNNAINDAIKQWEGERWVFNERRYRILTVASQEYYDLSEPVLLDSDGTVLEDGEMLLELDDITVTVNSQPYRLCQRSQQWFNKNQLTTSLGQPADYTIYGNQLRIFPLPDGIYTLNLNGLGRLGPAPLSSDLHTNAWMTEGEELIRAHAKMLLYRDVVRDPEGAAIAAKAMEGPEHHLQRKMAAKAYVGRQKAWSL
jgi:hypothetical protein